MSNIIVIRVLGRLEAAHIPDILYVGRYQPPSLKIKPFNAVSLYEDGVPQERTDSVERCIEQLQAFKASIRPANSIPRSSGSSSFFTCKLSTVPETAEELESDERDEKVTLEPEDRGADEDEGVTDSPKLSGTITVFLTQTTVTGGIVKSKKQFEITSLSHLNQALKHIHASIPRPLETTSELRAGPG